VKSNSSNGNIVATEYFFTTDVLEKLTTRVRASSSTERITNGKLSTRSGLSVGSSRGMPAEAVVETVTVTDVVLAPFSTAEFGETVHVEREGAPVQLKETVWLNPPLGAIEIE